MKKIILFVGLLFCGLTQAQTIIATANGETITEGQTFTFATTGLSSEIKLRVFNTSTTTPANVKLRMNSIVNNSNAIAEGEIARVQFCFGGLCYDNVQQGTMAPNQNTGVTLAPNNGSNPVQDHFYNIYEGDDPSLPVKYNMSFVYVGSDGQPTGSPIVTFNYIYDNGTASISDFTSLKNIGITVNNTVIKNNLNITTTQKAKMEVYNITGQIVKTAAIQIGSQAINMTDLSAAPYIVRFTNDKNQASQIKVVKQ